MAGQRSPYIPHIYRDVPSEARSKFPGPRRTFPLRFFWERLAEIREQLCDHTQHLANLNFLGIDHDSLTSDDKIQRLLEEHNDALEALFESINARMRDSNRPLEVMEELYETVKIQDGFGDLQLFGIDVDPIGFFLDMFKVLLTACKRDFDRDKNVKSFMFFKLLYVELERVVKVVEDADIIAMKAEINDFLSSDEAPPEFPAAFAKAMNAHMNRYAITTSTGMSLLDIASVKAVEKISKQRDPIRDHFLMSRRLGRR